LERDGSTVTGKIHQDGFKRVGGLSITPDGTEIFFGFTLHNGSMGIGRVSTAANASGTYEPVTLLPHQPNGMQADWERGVLYCTAEGDEVGSKGFVTAYDLAKGTYTFVTTNLTGADGAWLDENAGLLFVGQLVTKRIWVYDVVRREEVGLFEGLHSLSPLAHLLDDFTLLNGTSSSLGSTVIAGADWLGKQVLLFPIDASAAPRVLPPPSGITLHQPTSVRYGKGKGWSSTSLYISEGGGILASQTNRRIIEM
jgi:hypothetical protein